MIAQEVMMECPVTLGADTTVLEAIQQASKSSLDVLPIVGEGGRYVGAVRKSTILDSAANSTAPVASLCCDDALVCAPQDALENFSHDPSSSTPHRSIMVVDSLGRFRGVVPEVHWAVDEARVQSGHPRQPLEVRTYSMHLTWRCEDCGELSTRNEGIPTSCPSCGAASEAFCLFTED